MSFICCSWNFFLWLIRLKYGENYKSIIELVIIIVYVNCFGCCVYKSEYWLEKVWFYGIVLFNWFIRSKWDVRRVFYFYNV